MSTKLWYRMTLASLTLLLWLSSAPLSVTPAAGVQHASAATEPVTLTVWMQSSTDYTPAFQAYADAADTEVRINLQTFSMFEIPDRLKLAAAANDWPDLIIMPGWMVGSVNPNQIFTNLNRFSPGAVKNFQSATPAGVWGMARNEKITSIPLDSSPNVWFYRTDLFKKAGLPSTPDQVSAKFKNWGAIASAAKTFKAATSKVLFGDPAFIFDQIIRQKSPVYFDSKGLYIGDKNQQIKTAYDFVVQGFKEGWIGRYTPYGTNSNLYNDAFRTGNLGSVTGSYYYLKDEIIQRLKKGAKESWGIAALPGKTTDFGSTSAVVPQHATNRKAAIDLIGWLLSSDMQQWAYDKLGLFPVNLQVLSDSKWLNVPDKYFSNQNVRLTIAQASKAAILDPLDNETNGTSASYRAAINNLITNPKADPAKEWAAAVKASKTAAAKVKSQKK